MVKNLKDAVPKMVMHMMLNSTRDFIAEELVAILYSECNGAELMKESTEEIERKTEMIKIYTSLKEAVKIVTDININTTGTSAPPPVDNSWIQNDTATVRAPPPPRPSSTWGAGAPPQDNRPQSIVNQLIGFNYVR